jgi:predicted glycogen debranching enzyme
MLANTADTGRVEYNTADATLWLLHAVDRHITVTGDTDLGAELRDPLDAVIAHHLAGTRYGIRIDPDDGLLAQGAPGHALTWMDAVIDGAPVTPRAGKAVELNALWLSGLAGLIKRGHTGLEHLWKQGLDSFRRRFPNPAGGLFDTLDPTDPAVRPNQLLAYSLPHAPLRGAPCTFPSALLTPLGVRTLAPDDPGYRRVHRGSPVDRDSAYHQGTVWPWLIGPYADVFEADLSALVAHLGEWGLGSVSETADGDPPHSATGCPFQAWSVGEVRRIYQRVFSPLHPGNAGAT